MCFLRWVQEYCIFFRLVFRSVFIISSAETKAITALINFLYSALLHFIVYPAHQVHLHDQDPVKAEEILDNEPARPCASPSPHRPLSHLFFCCFLLFSVFKLVHSSLCRCALDYFSRGHSSLEDSKVGLKRYQLS